MFFTTPFTFIFSFVYFFVLFFMLSVSDFYVFWFFMELSTLVFMGVSYSIYKNNFSQLLIFFIIQTIAAFSLLVFFTTSFSLGFTFSFLLKMSMFPFYFWYVDLVSMFPNFLFFFSSTVFKLPSILILFYFINIFCLKTLFVSSILTIVAGSALMVFTNDYRFLLLASSISNNSWFVFSQLASFYFFILFLLFYSFFLFLSLLSLGNLFSSSLIKSYSEGVKFKLIIPILVLSGMPPFPIFFVKMLIAMFIISYYNAGVYMIFVMVSNVILLLSYFKVFFTLMMNQQSNQFFVWLSF